MVPHRLSEELWHTEALSIFHGWPHELFDCLLNWLGESTIGSSYCFKYCLSNRVFDVGGAPVSAAKVDSSSPELVREVTSYLVSLVEIPTTLLEDALVLPLDFLFVTVIHCWLWTMLGWIHIVSPRGVGTGIRPFSFWLWGSVLITLSSPFGMGATPVGAGGRSRPNWIGYVVVMLAVTFFCSGRSLSTSASIKAWRTSLKI